ncbi:hypothetical protein CHS0354_013603 [Potamilus streckersoni]|uniref:Uncharacterized protein n=1 Tax=Potamilus streckersoni TaxID=2493646 RepID=A0AAE0SKF9_9BIVA|nr:hypothetical protein CHS0354_013603 [Potamilus streckersoni]
MNSVPKDSFVNHSVEEPEIRRQIVNRKFNASKDKRMAWFNGAIADLTNHEETELQIVNLNLKLEELVNLQATPDPLNILVELNLLTRIITTFHSPSRDITCISLNPLRLPTKVKHRKTLNIPDRTSA